MLHRTTEVGRRRPSAALSSLVLMSPHAHGPHAHDHRSGSRRALLWVLGLTLAFTVVEVAGGIWTDSLALLADAGHMLSDNIAITLALVAVKARVSPRTHRSARRDPLRWSWAWGP